MRLRRQTKRLEIRPFRVSDYDAWKAYRLRTVKPRNRWDRAGLRIADATRAKFSKMLRGFQKDEKDDYFYHFGIFIRETGELIGFTSIMEVSRFVAQSAYLGYTIGSEYWGKGYGKEAVKATLDLGFKDLKLHRLEAGIEPENARSIALARSLGMRLEGRKKRCLYLRKKWVDLLIFTLTTEDLGLRFRGKI